MTYPLYLLHNHLGAVLLRSAVDLGMPRFGALGIAISGCIALSFLIALAIEPYAQPAFCRGLNALAGRARGAAVR